MKITFFRFIMLGLFIGFFSTCKKNNDTQSQPVLTPPTDTTAPPQTTAQKMQHKWNYDREEDTTFLTGGVFTSVIVYGTPGDYFDYRADNKRYGCVQNSSGPHFDTTNYVILNDSTFVIHDFDTARIKLLTETQFEYWFREGTPSVYAQHGYLSR